MDTASNQQTAAISTGSVGSVVLAFLASQHHTLMMLMLGAGMGPAGMSLVTSFPMVRRLMLLVSLGIAGLTLYRATSGPRPAAMRAMAVISLVLTLGLVGWSISQFGL